MNDTLLEYMEYRFVSDKPIMIAGGTQTAGPVITVSRETGCSGNEFVKQLSVFLNRQENRSGKEMWQWVNKEVIYETANELKVYPNRVHKLFKGEPRKIIDEIVDSMSEKYYINDRTITKAAKEIVKRIAARGNVVILGRGGVGLTRHVRESLHIKLYAPKHWRINEISRKLGLNPKDAAEFVDKTDVERNLLIRKFSTEDNIMDLFDIGFNCMTNSSNDIFSSIAGILRSRGLL